VFLVLIAGAFFCPPFGFLGPIICGVPVLVWSCAAVGGRRVFAILGLTDLLAPFPLAVALMLWWSHGLEGPMLWRIPVYGGSALLICILLSGRKLPDSFLPLKGRWGRKLWSLLAVGGLLLVLSWELINGLVTDREAIGYAVVPLLVCSVLVPLYLWPAWDVLARGWEVDGVPLS
jgi:hypothetical protein